MNENRQHIFFYVIMSISFVFMLFTVFMISLFSGSKSFSEVENRSLAQNPKWSLSSWLDKSYMKDYNAYRSDQFWGRNTWVNIKTKTEIALGKKELNTVYLGKDKKLFEPFTPTTKKQRENTLAIMNQFAAGHSGIRFQMMLVPNALAIHHESLPPFLEVPDQLKMMEETKASLTGYTWIDVVSPLKKHEKEYLYYNNDHHWTTLAAKYAFDTFASVNELDTSANPLEKYLISDNFYGTLAARSSYKEGKPDDIYMYVSSNEQDQSTTSYVEEQKKTATLYDVNKLTTNDPYAVFLNGNHPLVEINTTSSIDKNLLIFKDSYANCFIPFLTPYYSKIVVVDPRYYAGDVNQLMSDQAISDVLFLYNANTFYQDTSIDVLLAN